MRIYTKRKNKFYAVLISTLLVIQPLVAIDINANGVRLQGGGVHQPDEGKRTFVDGAKDTAPIVNINTPNNNGISHNTYNHFNVDTGGLILNNNAVNIQTELAGWIEGNPNLIPSNEAKLILNEVVSNNPSTLNGFMEVAGKKADVIVANPNGITLNGAGFINTNKVTLTTGTPFINSAGNLEKYVVNGGNIVVDGDTNLKDQSQVDILSRALILNKKLEADNLNIRLGANEIDANTLQTTKIESSTSAPNLSVDVSALGGMYANTISLQATDVGVGVNMQGELLSETTLDIDVDGNIIFGGKTQAQIINTNAKSATISGDILSNEKTTIAVENNLIGTTGEIQSNNIDIQSTQGNVDLNTKITATDTLNIDTKEELSLKNLDVTNSITLKSGEKQTLKGVIKSTILDIESTSSDVVFQGTISENEKTTIKANKNIAIDGSLTTKELMTDSSSGSITGDITATDNLSIITKNDLIGSSGSLTSQNIDIQSTQGNVDLNTKITATDTLNIDTKQNIKINNAIRAKRSINLQSGGSQTLNGALTASSIDAKSTNGDISIGGSTFTTQGSIVLDAGSDLDISGEVIAKDTISLQSNNNINVDGSIVGDSISVNSDNGNIAISSDTTSINDTTIDAKNGSLNVQGAISSGKTLTINGEESVTTTGIINSNKVTISSANGAIKLGNKITSGTSLELDAKDKIEVDGLIVSKENFTSSGGTFTDLKGNIKANSIAIDSEEFINIEGSVQSSTNLNINSGDYITITDQVSSVDNINIQSLNQITVNGSIKSDKVVLESVNNNVQVDDTIEALSKIEVLSGGSIRLNNPLISNYINLKSNDLLQVNGYINGYDTYLQSTNNNILIEGAITAKNILNINSYGILGFQGDINSDNTIDITASKINLTNTKIVAQNNLNLQTTQDKITLDKSKIQSKETDISIVSKGKLSLKNDSSISAKHTMNVQANSLELDASSISSGEKLTIDNDTQALSSLSNLNGSTIISENRDVEILANQLTNTDSQIIAGNDIHLSVEDFLNTHALVFAFNNLTIDNGFGGRANSITNKEADMVAFVGDLTLKANSVTNEGKAPTFIEDGYIATWYETATGSSDEIFEDTYKLFKDGIVDENSKIKPEYQQEYINLLTSLMKAEEPSDASKTLIKDTLIQTDGTLDPAMIGTWSQLSGKATQEGISDFDAHLKTLLVDKVSIEVQDTDAQGNFLFDANNNPIMTTQEVNLVNADGTIQEEYVDRYLSLWESAIRGDDLSQSTLDIIKTDAKDTNGYLDASFTSKWADIRTVTSAGYEIKKTLTADVLNTDGVLAQLIAGNNINIDTGVMNNQYANISAGGNIDITSDTSITNNAYGASQLLHEVHKTGCFICHVGQMGYRETFGGRIEAKGNINFTANTLANTVTATQNKTFNLPRLDEFHDLRADSNPVPESFVVVRNVKANEVDASEREALVDAKVGTINLDYIEEQTQQTFTQKESLTVSDLDQDTIKIDSVEEPEVISIDNTIIIKKEPVILDFGTYKLSVNTNKPYEKTIETRPTYTNYGAFLSSDYMVKRLQYSPEHENRMNSDEWSLNNSIRSATTISATNINFDIKDKITFEGDVSAKENLTIDTEGNLESSAELKSGATMDIDTGGDFIQSGGGIKAENLNLYTGGDLTLASTKVKAENSISLESKKNLNLDANRQTESGLRGDISWQNSRDIGTVVEANGNINFSSGEDMTLTAATVESKGGVTTLDSKGELNLNSGENYQEHTYTRTSSSSSWGGLKKKKTTTNHHEEHLTHTVTTIKGRDGVNFKGDENINLEGTKAIARTGDIAFNTEGDVNILAVTDKHLVEHDSKTKKSFVGMTYAKAGSSSTLTEIKNQGSISEAMGDISSKAGDTTTLQGAYFKSGGIVTINSSKGIQLLSVQDISDYKSESWSKGTNNYYYPGSLLSSQQKESLQKALTVSTLIDAKEVNLETDNNVVIKGSQIQADTVNFMASYLTLISDKNSESYSNFSDSSGVVVRKILSQGYIKEEAVEAKIDANQITLNGKTLLEDKLNPDSLLKQLSSESNLNHEQIEQIKVELNNKEWNDKTTTLSKMGMIIVQAVVTVFTAGAGTGLVEAGNQAIQAMIDAMINSLVSQMTSQIATSAITGNKLDLDLNNVLENSLKAATLSGLTTQIDTSMGYDATNLNYGQITSQEILHASAQTLIYGGDIEDILINSAGAVAFNYVGHDVYGEKSQFPQLRDNVPKTVIHSLIGGTLLELKGGDFSSGAISTATAHSVAEYMDNELLEKTVKGEISKEEAKAYVKAMSLVVSGAVVLATNENITDEELKIAQDMGESVVENNYLKGFDAKVEFGKGIFQGGGEKVWEDLKALGVALTSPIETAKALANMLNSDAIKSLAIEQYNEIVDKYNNVYSALFSDTAYEGEKAKQAGKDLGALTVSILEAYTGVKGIATLSSSAKEILSKAAKTDTFASVPKKLDYVTSSGVKLEANPNKTTTVLGSYTEDMANVLKETNYPKTLDFEAKQGGFNVLNTPDELYKSSEQFWNEYNKPFLDKAIERGDDIVLATKPDDRFLSKIVDKIEVETGFGREINYLELNGYKYDSISNKMIKGK